VLIVLSSNAISADAGYRSPRESKRRGRAIGDEQVGSVLAARVSVPSVTLPLAVSGKNFIKALDFKRLRYVKVAS
jgi:hypothetical protein